MIAEKRKLIKWTETSGSQQDYLVKEEEEWIAREINLRISINGKELIRFACSPIDCEDLAIGFLFTEGIISGLEEIDHIIQNKDDYRIEFILSEHNKSIVEKWSNSRTMSSGCGQGVISNLESRRKNLQPLDSKITANPKCLAGLFQHLKNHSEWYEKTGCIHQVTLFCNDESFIIREDIGRHNGVDKAIGAALQCQVNLEQTIIYCSGRLSSDMVLKAAKARIPIVVSRAAPTSLAVDIANESGITLIGFARGRKLNIYSHPERISFDEEQSEVITKNLFGEGSFKNK
jgi:FdhD protein